MKPWRWSLWVAMAALVFGGMLATPAQAVFSDGTTITVSQLQAAPADCGNLVWRTSDVAGGLDSLAYKRRWFNYGGPSSNNLPILSFRIDNGDATDDTLFSMYVHSIAERTNTISQLRLYWDSTVAGMTDTNAFFGGGNDVLVGVANPGAFQTNDSVLINLTRPIIVPASGNVWFNMVVDLNGIGTNPTYDMTGVGVELRPERVCMGNIGCGPAPGDTVDLDCVPTSPANNAYSIIIDNQGPECADLSLQNIFENCIGGDCYDGETILSLGDSLLIRLTLDIVNVPNDTCKTGWPKVFVREFTNNATSQTMGRFKGYLNYDEFAYVAEFDSTNGDGPYDLMNIGPTVNNPIDVPAGFYYLVAELQDAFSNASRCSLLVPYDIDTDKPVVAGRPSSWTLHYDANGNGIVNPGDTVRFFLDMSNEPFGEMCEVWTTIYDFYAVPVGITLVDDAGDRLFEGLHEVVAGILDSAGPISAWLHAVDNACNEDSIQVDLTSPVDNIPPQVPPGEFLRLLDTDQNGCLMIGESVRIQVQGITDDDLVSITADILGAGLGDLGGVSYDAAPLLDQSGGLWRLDWILGDLPQDSAIDYAAGDVNAVVYLTYTDDADNSITIPTSYLEAASGGYNIDTDIPEPVVDLACESGPFGVINLNWAYGDQTPDFPSYRVANRPQGGADYATFQIYYDNGTGSDPNILVAEISPTTSWTTDGTITLTDGVVYRWTVWGIDDCGNAEIVHPLPVACQSDASAPSFCIFQPDTGNVYTCDVCSFVPPMVSAFEGGEGGEDVFDAVTIPVVPFHGVGNTSNNSNQTVEDCGIDPGATGADVVYVFSPSSSGLFDISLDNDGTGYDSYLYVYENSVTPGAPYACDDDGGSGLRSLIANVYLTAGNYYYIVVSGWGGSSGNYELTVGPPAGAQPIHVYILAQGPGDEDLVAIDTVLARVGAHDGIPAGPWTPVCFNYELLSKSDDLIDVSLPTCNAGENECLGLPTVADLVSDGNTWPIEIVVLGTDEAGNVQVRDSVLADCGPWNFWFANNEIEGNIVSLDGLLEIYQNECDDVAFAIDGPTSEVCISVAGGTPPYKIRAFADDDGEIEGDDDLVWYVENVFATDTCFTLITQGWSKGTGEIMVEWCDATGAYDNDDALTCIPDTIPPCAEISNPVDGKCIRRSLSMLDPVDVCVTLNPLGNCLDPENVVKIDYQWADTCCLEGFYEYFLSRDSTPCPGGIVINPPVCDTFPQGATDPLDIDSIVCRGETADTVCWIITFDVDSNLVECEDSTWRTFSIQSGGGADGGAFCTQWWNTQDLAGYESGDIIFLRAVLYDEYGNKFITPCVQVCVDVDVPDMCLWAPDFCFSDGRRALANGDVVFYATIDTLSTNFTIDDLEDVTLWYKRATDDDRLENWISDGSGFLTNDANPGGTNSTLWKWEFNTSGLQDQTYYDFRVIAKTVWGTYAFDYNGDGDFDAHTYDTTFAFLYDACYSGHRWFIDRSAPQIAIDTAWTIVNADTVVQPNAGCTMSDPRGWIWTQFGNDITVQPNLYPWLAWDGSDNWDDVKRVQWTLYSSSASCQCVPGEPGSPDGSSFNQDEAQSWVIAVNEGANPMQNLTFNPADAPWLSVQSGVQSAVLHVELWDSCGNSTEDCVTIYLLDVDPTDAVIVSPKNDSVFCTAPGGTAFGGITIRSAAILEEGWNKAVYAYRPAGTTEWIEFDSVGISADPDKSWQTYWTQVTWNPVAYGLTDGSYELTVWAVDNALNRSTNLYIVTVHLSCAPPTVQLIHPSEGNPEFIGCDIELEAVASSPDPLNPITRVDFYVGPITESTDDPEWELVGSDFHSVDGHWGYHWLADSINNFSDGPHFIYAKATNKAGMAVQTDMLWIKIDNTNPIGTITQVGDDLSNGGVGDPTVVQAGDQVDLWGWARDVSGGWGAGEEDNCGVDSVVFYVYDDGFKVAGYLATPDAVIDSVYTAVWSTTGLSPDVYTVRMEVFDCACNSYVSSDQWYVRVDGPAQEPVISVDGPVVCDVVTVDGGGLVTVSVDNVAYVDHVRLAWSNTIFSDVEDQYTYSSNMDLDEIEWDGSGVYAYDLNTSQWDEGVYRLRAVIYYEDNTVSEDGDDAGTDFDDFTFDPAAHDYHMMLRVSHSATPFTVTTDGETFQAGEDICFTVVPVDTCDVATVMFGVGEGDDTFGNGEGGLEFCFDPVDSSGVTLNNCGSWNGDIYVTVCDVFGHCTSEAVHVWILDVAGPDSVAITSPGWSEFITPSNNTVAARMLSGAGIDSVQFFASNAQFNGTATYIGSSVASGDEFSVAWDLEGVAEGQYWLYGVAFNDEVGVEGSRCPATVAVGCDGFALTAPNPSFERTVNGTVFTFVGPHSDLCVDADGISSIVSGVGIESISWYFRDADAPGVTIEGNLDPNRGWVLIGSDIYGSLCVDWFTDWCDYLSDLDLLGEYGYDSESPCCSDGRYTVVARVTDKAGNECHSVPMNVMIDISDPFSEIVDIDGDETFETCHEVVLPEDEQVKFSAVAIDDHSCTDKEPYQAWNSGAKYLQFFVGGCGANAGCLDIVFVQDGSGSMGDDQEAISSNAQLFAEGLGDADFRLGVLGYTNIYQVVNTNGGLMDAQPGNGVFTTNLTEFQTMITAVGDELGDGGTENGLTAMNWALEAYPWRENCVKAIILVTDEDADDFADYSSLFPNIVSSDAFAFGVISFADSAGYSKLGSATGGALYEIEDNWGANLAAVASQLGQLAAGSANDVGIVWGQTVELTDGQDDAFALWNPTGLAPGTYCAWTVVVDNVGNSYKSAERQICVIDRTPPVAHITGFGQSNDPHMADKYTIYAQTWDNDVDYVQFQYRLSNSNTETDWTGIGISSKVNGDSTCWMTTWNPCVLSGTYDLRAVPTDKNGNQDMDAQPIATVSINNCVITPTGGSTTTSAIWFEDERFDDLGLVHVDLANGARAYHNMLSAVWADELGNLSLEKIDLWAPDPENEAWQSGNFDGTDNIKFGGEGWFWVSYTDNANQTHLAKQTMNVWRVKSGLGGCSFTHEDLNAKVCIDPGALDADNGIVVYPARAKVLSPEQQHYWAIPAFRTTRFPVVTAIRLTNEVSGFHIGEYAAIKIAYDEDFAETNGLVANELAIGWWDGDEWNINDEQTACDTCGVRDDGTAYSAFSNLHGLYAVVSGTRPCRTGAIVIENFGAEFHVGNLVGSRPTIYTTVRSAIEMNNGNSDINSDEITVVLDGQTTLYSNGENPDNDFYSSSWDPTTGILTTEWTSEAPALTEGEHTLYVQAFSNSGYCDEFIWEFDVDATPPDVDVVGAELCPNPTFEIIITDEGGAGVNWSSVFVDVYDITGGVYDELPESRRIHTETYDAFEDGEVVDTFSFTLVDNFPVGHRLKIIIYNGDFTVNSDCNCIYYDWLNDGVADLVGNNTQVVQEDFTITAGFCDGDGGGGDGPDVIIIGNNPFDPFEGESITFQLVGFSGRDFTAAVYDVSGVKVKTLATSGGSPQVTWAGDTDAGTTVAQGVYIAHFQGEGTSGRTVSAVAKVVLKRHASSD